MWYRGNWKMNNSIVEIALVVVVYITLNTYITFKYVKPYLIERRNENVVE